MEERQTSQYKRVGHIAVAYKHYVLVWGGFKHESGTNETYYPSDEVWFYDSTTEVWSLKLTSGDHPFRNSGSSAVICEDYLYIYGGVEDFEESSRYSNDLHRLNLKTFIWSKLTPSGLPPICCDKGVGWEYDGKIYFFGGYGRRSHHTFYGYDFDTDVHNLHGDRGWHNQLTVYDPSQNSWSSPELAGIEFSNPLQRLDGALRYFVPLLQTNGQPPLPRATHAVDRRGKYIYIFGGRMAFGRVNDLHCLDLEKMTWKEIRCKGGIHDIPEGRSWHSFNFISEDHAILYGGLNSFGSPCKDWWECILDGNKVDWKLKGELKRFLVWHKGAYMPLTNEIIIVGGVTCSPYSMRAKNHVGELLILPFSPVSLLRICLEQILKQKLWFNSCLPKCLMDTLIARSGAEELDSV